MDTGKAALEALCLIWSSTSRCASRGPRKDGSLFSTLKAPEGPRQAVLFSYAAGNPPLFPPDEAYCLNYGRAVARIHTALDDFTSRHARFSLDLDHLVARPLQTTLPLLEDHPEDQAYLLRLGDEAKERLTALPLHALEWGACHGDFHGGNVHLAPDQQLVFFDFDCGGPGWRAYDMAVFRWSCALHHPEV